MFWTKDTFCFMNDNERQSWINGMKNYSINLNATAFFRELQKPFRVTDIDPVSKGVVRVEIDGISYTGEDIGVGIIFLLVDRGLFKKVNVSKNSQPDTGDDETLLELLNTFHLHTVIRIGNVDVKNKKHLLAILKKRHRDALKSTELAASDLRKEINKKQEKLSLHEGNIKAMKNSLPG